MPFLGGSNGPRPLRHRASHVLMRPRQDLLQKRGLREQLPLSSQVCCSIHTIVIRFCLHFDFGFDLGGDGIAQGWSVGTACWNLTGANFKQIFCMVLNGDVGSDKFDAGLLLSLSLFALPPHCISFVMHFIFLFCFYGENKG